MKDILEKYDVAGNTTGKHYFGEPFGEVDFDKLTLAEADLLHQAGCGAFKLKVAKPTKPAPEK